MAAQDYTAVVQQLYLSYFGRPADYFGLQNFSAQLDAMGAPKTFAAVQAAVGADAAGTTALSKLVNTFSNSPESIALYGNDNSQVGISKFVAAIYQNVLGRPAELDGFNFWVNAITSGTLSKANAAAAISQAATVNTTAQGLLDAQAVAKKVAVATNFTTALDTPAELTAYAGDAAAAAGRGLLSGVNSSTDVAAYQSVVNSTITGIVTGSAPVSNLALTANVDNIVGTNAADTITALVGVDATAANAAGVSTLNTGDAIDGGAGIDTLNLIVGQASTLPSTATIKNVEVINITGANFITGGVDAAYFAGSTTINLQNTALATNVTGLSGKTLGVQGKSAAITGDFGTAAAATVQLTGSSAVAGGATNAVVNLTGTGIKTVTVNGSGRATVDATGAAVETLNVNATGAITLDAQAEATSIKTINAAGSTAGVTLVGAYTAAETITTGNGADTFTVGLTTTGKTATVNSGAGNDTITVALVSNAANINAGAGDDTIIFNRALTTTDVVNGGEGKDTLTISNNTIAASDLAILKSVVTNVETLKFSAAATGVDAAALSQFSTFSFTKDASVITKVADTQTVATIADVTVTAAGYIGAGTGTPAATATTYAGKLTVDVLGSTVAVAADPGATPPVVGSPASPTVVTANADSITLNVKAVPATAGAAGVATFAELTGDVKSATVNLTNSVNAGTNSTATADVLANFSLTTSNAKVGAVATNGFSELGALTTLTLTGNGSATIVNGATGVLANIDATAMTGKATSGVATVTGGLDYTTSANVAETIKLGAGRDIVRIDNSSTYEKMDTITGLTLVKNAAGAFDAAASDDILIAGGATFTKAATVTGSTFDLVLTNLGAVGAAGDNVVFAYGGDTYIYSDVGANGLTNDDVVVKLTGTIDLDLLVSALNGGAFV